MNKERAISAKTVPAKRPKFKNDFFQDFFPLIIETMAACLPAATFSEVSFYLISAFFFLPITFWLMMEEAIVSSSTIRTSSGEGKLFTLPSSTENVSFSVSVASS